jgi:16S rRNA (adenine1518-N6/adenine1519-N6)-dimethyltransferase
LAQLRKRFGQHFLEPVWVEKVLRAIDPQPTDDFIEIGPGAGALTFPLAARVRYLTAFEIDRDLSAQLKATAWSNVTITEGDFLETFPGPAVERMLRLSDGEPLRVAGNLPYNAASPMLFALSDAYVQGLPLRDATLMLQRELADRLTATPGTKDYGAMTVLVRHTAHVDRLLALPPGAFRPPPKVRSALVRLRFHAPAPPVANRAWFGRLVSAVFTRRRKTLTNALAAVPAAIPPARALAAAGIDGGRRPETLSVEEFARLADAYSSTGMRLRPRPIIH